MRDSDLPHADERPDAMIAGTLCLMSCYAQHPAPVYAARIAGNLAALAGSGTLTAEFRAVCRRMAERWHVLEVEARGRCACGAPVRDERTLQ
ncbi:MAG: hypothetical protein IT519_08295 [Burkholderiales bacterium]|jgi:hypothetical protein|nr:hypothetical protein [Burkholderiales bacterium]